MADSLPEFINYEPEASFDSEEFYWNKIVPFRDIFEDSSRHTSAMVNGILEEEVDEDVNDLGRMRILLTGTQSNNRKTDYSPLKSGLEEKISEFDQVDFSTWYNDFIDNIIPFSNSRQFRTYSIRETPPPEYRDIFEPVETLVESADDFFTDNRVNIFGSSHYVMRVDQFQFKEEYGLAPSKLAQEGYIGREGTGGHMRIFINNDLVKSMTSIDVDSNPYTP